MCRVENNYVYFCFHQGFHTIQDVCSDTYCRAAEQTSLCILCRERILDLFLNILDSNKTLEVKILVHDRKLLDTCLGKNLLCLRQGDALRSGNQMLRSHALFNLLREIFLELEVTVCDNTNQFSSLCDRNTGNPELAHQLIRIL